jgi:hypothetical protein
MWRFGCCCGWRRGLEAVCKAEYRCVSLWHAASLNAHANILRRWLPAVQSLFLRRELQISRTALQITARRYVSVGRWNEHCVYLSCLLVFCYWRIKFMQKLCKSKKHEVRYIAHDSSLLCTEPMLLFSRAHSCICT